MKFDLFINNEFKQPEPALMGYTLIFQQRWIFFLGVI
jgi:hypothetical protein